MGHKTPLLYNLKDWDELSAVCLALLVLILGRRNIWALERGPAPAWQERVWPRPRLQLRSPQSSTSGNASGGGLGLTQRYTAPHSHGHPGSQLKSPALRHTENYTESHRHTPVTVTVTRSHTHKQSRCSSTYTAMHAGSGAARTPGPTCKHSHPSLPGRGSGSGRRPAGLRGAVGRG